MCGMASRRGLLPAMAASHSGCEASDHSFLSLFLAKGRTRRDYEVDLSNAKTVPVTIELRQNPNLPAFKLVAEPQQHDIQQGRIAWRVTLVHPFLTDGGTRDQREPQGVSGSPWGPLGVSKKVPTAHGLRALGLNPWSVLQNAKRCRQHMG